MKEHLNYEAWDKFFELPPMDLQQCVDALKEELYPTRIYIDPNSVTTDAVDTTFDTIVFPLIKKAVARTIAADLVPVVPMSSPKSFSEE